MPRRSKYGSHGARYTQPWTFRLYVSNETPKCVRAARNIERICKQYLANCRVEVIDILTHPQLAQSEGIVVVPTLVCSHPSVRRRLVGDLSNTERVAETLGFAREIA